MFTKIWNLSIILITNVVLKALGRIKRSFMKTNSVKFIDMKKSDYLFRPFILQKINISSSSIKPSARSGHRIVSDERYLYLFGGYNPKIVTISHRNNASPLFGEMWRFNFSSGEWELLPVKNIPVYLASSYILLVGDMLFVYGGSGVPFGANSSNKLFICDLCAENLEFKQVETTGLNPPPGYGQACFMNKHIFYVIGGTSGFTYWCDIDALDMRTNRWELVYTCSGIQDEPKGRYRHELAKLDDRIYILGGGTSEMSFGFVDIHVFSCKDKTWTLVKTCGDILNQFQYPKPRRFHSSVQVDSKVYISGGMHQRNALSDTWYLDLLTLQWHYVNSLSFPSPTFFHDSCATSAGKMYSFGGVVSTNRSTTRSSDLWEAWLCIPSLKEMSWEALLFYGLQKYDEIVKLIPFPFRKRIE